MYLNIFSLLQEQMRMQKKMHIRLKHYKSNYENEFYKENKDYREDERRRA